MQRLMGEDDPFACFGSNSSSDDECDGDPNMREGLTIRTKSTHSDGSNSSNSSDAESEGAKRRRLVAETNATLEGASRRRQDALANAGVERVPLSSPDFEVFDAPAGRGRGLRALRGFSYGDEILREAAAVRVPNQQAASSAEGARRLHERAVCSSFDDLHPTTQRAYLELSSCEQQQGPPSDDTSPLVGIYQTNSYKLGDEADGGLFLTLARINHSCRPNSSHIWRPDLQQTLVFATKDIAAGDEIFTTYGPAGEWLDTAGRRSYLRERFSFDCRCDMCQEGDRTGGDRRMEEIGALQEELSWLDQTEQPHAAIEAVERCRSLLEAQGNGSGVFVKSLLHRGYQISMFGLDDRPLARDYLSQELLATNMCEGPGSPNAVVLQRMLDEIAV